MEDEDKTIDFSWFYFIGITKLKLPEKRVGQLTIRLFNKLYKHYKNNFDYEMRLKNSNTTYQENYNKAKKEDRWF